MSAELDAIMQEVCTPEVPDDTDGPDGRAQLGRTMIFGYDLYPDDLEAFADALRAHAALARRVAPASPDPHVLGKLEDNRQPLNARAYRAWCECGWSGPWVGVDEFEADTTGREQWKREAKQEARLHGALHLTNVAQGWRDLTGTGATP